MNRNKNRCAIVPFPCEQSIFAFQKLERRWNGTIAFPCERGLSYQKPKPPSQLRCEVALFLEHSIHGHVHFHVHGKVCEENVLIEGLLHTYEKDTLKISKQISHRGHTKRGTFPVMRGVTGGVSDSAFPQFFCPISANPQK